MAIVTGKLILKNLKGLQSHIIKDLRRELDKRLGKNLRKIESELQLAVRGALLLQPEVQSLLNRGKLQAEFGIRDSRDAITEIIDFWVSNIVVRKTPVRVANGKLLKSNIIVNMIRADYHDVTSIPAANIYTDKGAVLPWLSWLLTFGDKYIVRDYEIKYAVGNFRFPFSRSGGAIMVPAPKKAWRVPPEFSGTQNNNFVTRAIDSIDSRLEDILQLVYDN